MLRLREEHGKVFVVGRSYPVKDRLRAAGFRYCPTRQMWWTRDPDHAKRVVDEINLEGVPVERAPIRTDRRVFERMLSDFRRLTPEDWAELERRGVTRMDGRGAVFQHTERQIQEAWAAAQDLLAEKEATLG